MTSTGHTLTQSVRIPVADGGVMCGYLARPVDDAGASAVIVGMELFGVSAHVRDVCDRLASLGYLALAPDLYHRSAPGIELPADEDGRTRGFTLLQQLTRAQVIEDIGATIDFLRDRGNLLAGMVGLSVGGHIAYLAATRLDLPVVAVCYGGWISNTDISISQPEPTIAGTAAITGRMLMLVGENDPIVPPEQRQQIADALRTAGVDHEIVEYPGAGHGFLCERRDSYHAIAANDAWQRLARFLSDSSSRP